MIKTQIHDALVTLHLQFLEDRRRLNLNNFAVALLAPLTAEELIGWLRELPFMEPGVIHTVTATSELPAKTDRPESFLFWNCSNRNDLSALLLTLTDRPIFLLEDEENIAIGPGASSAEISAKSRTWFRLQKHARLLGASTISSLHGGVLPPRNAAGSLLDALADP